ncbi:tail fiber assembly protein [Salmonella enterica]|nr:tail fiber assembly protein [Salmonella enterica]EBI0350975.1 tail fiber assembly protein [Salmonella enterica subsp. arizonae serovar 48:z4,z23,z32:-]EDR7169078.1 tail fiber assembly protein [Salmonella enterica subsp. houtenae]EFL9222285.1 tail fiber assembly protein [Escherichia coli]EBB3994445.1 tail fiber assembly protein [Salmonella enterica]
MKYFKTNKNEVYAYDDDADKKYFRKGLVAITEAEAKEILNQPVTAEQLKAQNESNKAFLLDEANTVITMLERAVRLNMATEKEIQLLNDWERYSVMVNRVNTSNPDWPKKPE